MKVYTDKSFNAPHIKALFYGHTGNGKTRTAYSSVYVPELCPVLGINVGGNPLSIKDYPQDNLTIIEPTKVSELETVLNWLATGQEKPVSWAPLGKYKTVVLDGLSDSQALFEHTITGGQGTLNNPTTIDGYKQWGQMLTATLMLAKGLWQMDMHVIVTALERYIERSDTYEPALYGQSNARIAHIPYIVARLTSLERADKALKTALSTRKADNDVQRVMQIKATKSVPYAKWQYGASETYVLNPDMSKLYRLVAQ